jgi:hypothetical protein
MWRRLEGRGEPLWLHEKVALAMGRTANSSTARPNHARLSILSCTGCSSSGRLGRACVCVCGVLWCWVVVCVLSWRRRIGGDVICRQVCPQEAQSVQGGEGA